MILIYFFLTVVFSMRLVFVIFSGYLFTYVSEDQIDEIEKLLATVEFMGANISLRQYV